MSPSTPWRPMATAPETVARIWLDHLTLGPILAEGRDARWYAPCAARQVWRWYRSAEPDGLNPFRGWLPFADLPADADAPVGGVSGDVSGARPSPSGRRERPAPSP